MLNKPYTKNKKEVDSKTNSNVKDSLETCSPYFNAIITYPHPSDSNEFPRSEEKKINREVENSYRKKNSSDERSKSLIMENGSYFILPKKTKNLSNQSHLNKMQTDYTKAGENNLNIIKLRDEKNLEIKNVARSTGKNENTDDDKADESKLTTQARTFIPVPLIVPLNAIMNSKPTSSEMFEINSKKENITKSLNNITQKEITMYDKNNLIADQTNLSLQGVETLNSSGPVSEIRISTVEKINHIQILRSIEPQDMSAKQDMIDKLINNHESKNYELDGNQIIKITTSKENFSKSNEDSAEDTKYYLDDQTDFKSGPLLAVREKSLLDIIVDQAESNSPQNQSEKYQDVPFTSQDLSHIWENETKALKSMADVITKRTMLSTNNNDHDEEELLKFEKTEKPAGEVDMKQKTQLFLHETTSKTDLQAGAVTPSNSTKTSTKDVTKEMLFNKEQNVIDYTNVGDAKIPTFFVENKEVQNHGSETRINKNREDSKTQEKIFKNLEKLVLTETNIENKENVEILKSKNTADAISKYDEPSNKNYNLISQKNMINKQNDNLEHIDDFNFNKEEVIKVAFKEECPSFSEDDDITIKGLFPYSKQSISDQSIMGSGSSTYIAGNTSGKEDDKLPKINSKSNPEETIYVQTRENEILNDGALKQIPYMTLQNQKVELKTQFESMNDTGELNIESGQISLNNLPEVWYKASETTPPAMILRKDVVPWKIDLALQSYLDENNEKIIKSFNSTDVPERRLNDAFLVARCYLGDDLNEIKIPIDQDNNLTVKIVNVRAQHRTLVDNENVNLKDEIFEKKKIKMDVPNKSQHLSQASIYGSSKVNDELYRKNKIKINVPGK